MALAAGLGKAGLSPQKVSTTAAVTIDKVGEGFKITKIKLTCEANVPGGRTPTSSRKSPTRRKAAARSPARVRQCRSSWTRSWCEEGRKALRHEGTKAQREMQKRLGLPLRAYVP